VTRISTNYRPITDVWMLARPKVKYYGAYPNGFLERAKPLIGVRRHDPVLHVCGGQAKRYPNKRVMGPSDFTLDLDPETGPDFLQDCMAPLPLCGLEPWAGVLIDRPYTRTDAAQYAPGVDAFPDLNRLLRHALQIVQSGGKVGVLDYIVPQPPKGTRFVACVGVVVGFNNRIRCFSVFEAE
jgi:hypothetical protein